ncbi:feruloyl ortho-hydroxylase 1 [Olea europaea subsp. europaea]|uniref:feruloyl-CoA 6-hydroxylase n=1 Tax=Olea europaea subsp. europaea TaxID=158383 RepID=A0A8S0U6L9_OLEEU|nr:feruloyl ortho-hydroxylase 1 [Olea europaea subsp. europaea]
MAPSFDDENSLFDFVVKNGNGVKGLVDSGIAKVPKRYVQPPQERIDKLDAFSQVLSPIDLSKLDQPAEHDQVAETIIRAAETLGFFQVVNHGVPVELLEALKDAAHKFFAQPPKKKAVYLKAVSPSPLIKYGTSFVPEKEKALEWKDYISMTYTNDAEALEHWPNQCKEVALEYLKASTKMVWKLIEVLLKNLGVTQKHNSIIEALTGQNMVNMNFYPACPDPELTVGVGRHSDLGTITVLLQDGIGGLYVKAEENIDTAKKPEWIEIPPIPGALVINVGDTLQVKCYNGSRICYSNKKLNHFHYTDTCSCTFQILSNGRYKSAEHRVRTTSTQSRVSIPFFTTPKRTTKIGPLPQLVTIDQAAHYREVTFGDYMDHFFGNAHEGKKSLDFTRNSSD